MELGVYSQLETGDMGKSSVPRSPTVSCSISLLGPDPTLTMALRCLRWPELSQSVLLTFSLTKALSCL